MTHIHNVYDNDRHFIIDPATREIKNKTLQGVVDQCITSGSTVECDAFQNYRSLKNVDLDLKNYEVGDMHWLHIVISNFKTFLKGTYHGRCTNLQSYMDEFDFRFNRRMTGNQMFMRLTRAVATSCALLS